MALVALSEDGKYFSAISPDGRLKIWDTETNVLKQEYTPDLHLSSPPACLQWITVTNTADTQKKGGRRKSSHCEQEIQCVALGTTSSKILIYNVAQAKVETVLEDDKKNAVANNSVTCLDWHRKYGLYSCSKENYVYEWDINKSYIRNKYNVNEGSKNKQANGITAIRLVPHNQDTPAQYLVTASWQLRIWRLHLGTASVVKNLGHVGSSKAVMMTASLQSKCYIVEGSHNERLLSFWDATITADLLPDSRQNDEDFTPSRKHRRKSISDVPSVTNPTYNFVLEDAPRIVDFVMTESEGGVLVNLAASTRSGVLHYYNHMLNGMSTKPIKPTVTVQITTEDAKPMPLKCCKFTKVTSQQNAGEMIIGYNSTSGQLMFERVIPDTATKTQVLIRSHPKESKGMKSRKKEDTNKVRSSAASEQAVTYLEPMGGVTRKRVAPAAKLEVPMEARLANLALDVKSRGKSAVNQNLTKLLIQGLHSRDKSLIQIVLQKDDPLVAKKTVSNLPADYIPMLLEQLTHMASRKTSQCAAVCMWLQALIRHHSALLLATLHTSATADKFTKLLAILTQRRSHLCQLLNLKGRLDLTIAQRSQDNDAEENDEAVLEYADTSSDEDMDIENRSSSASLEDQHFDISESEQDGAEEETDADSGEE